MARWFGVRIPTQSSLEPLSSAHRLLLSGYRGSFLGLNRPGSHAKHSPPSSARLGNGRAVPPLPLHAFVTCRGSFEFRVQTCVQNWAWEYCRTELGVGVLLYRIGRGSIAVQNWAWEYRCTELGVGVPLYRTGCGSIAIQNWVWEYCYTELYYCYIIILY